MFFRKIVDFLLVICQNNLVFSKITSSRWHKENNRLLFSITGMTTAYVMLEWMQIDVCSVSDSRTVKNWLFMVERKTRVMVSVCRKLIPQKQIKGHPVSTNLMTSFLRCLFWSLLYVLYRHRPKDDQHRWLTGGRAAETCQLWSLEQPATGDALGFRCGFPFVWDKI